MRLKREPSNEVEHLAVDGQVLQTKGFTSILEHLERIGDRNYSIIDLGQINSTVFDALTSYGSPNFNFFNCSLRQKFVEASQSPPQAGTYSHLEMMPPAELQDNLEKHHEDYPIEIIVAWDLLNYLSKRSIVELMALLSPFCKRGAVMHALVWTDGRIPIHPMKFEVNQLGELVFHTSPNSESLEIPPYTAQTIRSLMPSFNIVRLSALSIGMHDCLFEFESLQDPPNPELITLQSTIPTYRQYKSN